MKPKKAIAVQNVGSENMDVSPQEFIALVTAASSLSLATLPPMSRVTMASAVSPATPRTCAMASSLAAVMRVSASAVCLANFLLQRVALAVHLGVQLVARLLRDAVGLGAGLRQSRLIGDDGDFGLFLEAGRLIQVMGDPVAALLDHRADARQRHAGHDEVEHGERDRQPDQLRSPVARNELRHGFGSFVAQRLRSL